MKGELDGLKSELNREAISIQELKSDNHTLSDLADKRGAEISRLKVEYEDALERRKQLIAERKSVENQVNNYLILK